MSDDPREIPTATPVTLDYATPTGRDEVPDFVPVAEAAIDNGASIRRVGAAFRTPAMGAAYVSRSLHRRFSPESTAPTCGRCGAPTTVFIAYEWTFVVPSRWWITIGDVRATGFTATCHAWCEACARPLRRRAARIARVRRIGTILAWVGGGLLVISIVMSATANDATLRKAAGDLWGGIAFWTAAAGGVALFGGLCLLAGGDSYTRWRIPREVRRAVPRWLQCRQYLGAFDRAAEEA